MSIRKIEIKVTSLTEPKEITRLWGGIQYEDNATEIVFDVSQIAASGMVYRIDFNSAAAGYHPSENLTVASGKIKRCVPKYITQYGGEVQVTAIATLIGTENEVRYSYPIILEFSPVEKSEHSDSSVEGNISEMEITVRGLAQKAEDSADTAAVWANNAENSAFAAAVSEEAAKLYRNQTEDARFSLEQNSEFVFLGGDAEGSVEADLAVDSLMSDISSNPIANKTAKAYIDGEFSKQSDYVVEQGSVKVKKYDNAGIATDFTWSYRKWNSGISECFGLSYEPVGAVSSVGNVYIKASCLIELPTNLFSADMSVGRGLKSQVTCEGYAYGIANLRPPIAETGYKIGSYIVYPIQPNAEPSIQISYNIKGRWK